MPAVDIIVPCHNYGRFLRACVGSVLERQGCEVRVLIIDDASTDDSLDTARGIAAEDPRVQVLAHETNRGHIATYNEGIEWLGAEYMLLLSSDDMLAPMALSRATGLMEADPRVGFVYGTAIRFTDEAEIATAIATAAPPAAVGPATVQAGPDFIRRLCAKPVNPVETATAVVRTALQKRVGGYRSELPHAGDLEMWLRLAAHGHVGVIPAVQAFTRIHACNMRHGYHAGYMRADLEQRRLAFEMFFAGELHRVDAAGDLARMARRSLAEDAIWAAARCFEETDDPATSQLVDLARAIDASIIRTPLWWKTAVKRAVGRRAWRAVAPMLTAMRSPAGRGASTLATP